MRTLKRKSSMTNSEQNSNATFKTVTSFWAQVEEEPSGEKRSLDPRQVTRFVKKWSRSLGAVSVGVTELKDYHKYSIIGRTEPWGGPVTLDHRFAIAFTVEMNKVMVDRAPYGPTVMESAQQYLNSGAIALQVANFIRELGFEARAHLDGNYRVVCPLVARDAGLGEIGRMGILMTPELGPRVRIAVVTTDMPLMVDPPRRDETMIDFCARCKKCANVCPSKAISFDDRETIDGALRWRINQEKCFTYWCAVGTDCSRCMKVCPYSHPDNVLHNAVRWGVRRSALFRELAIVLDDFFYGKLPPPADVPDWMTASAGADGPDSSARS
jgi:ferredoxin